MNRPNTANSNTKEQPQKRMGTLVPHSPKTGHYVGTYGCFNAATTDIIRGCLKQA
jgi:hypothetical protein